MDNKLKEFIRQWSNYEFSTGGMTGTGRENHYCTLEELAGELSRLYT